MRTTTPIEAAGARGISPSALGALTFSLMLAYFWLSGALFPGDVTGFWMTPRQITGASLTYSTTPAFLLASLRYASRQNRIQLDQLVDSGTLTREAAASRGVAGAALGRAQNVTATIVGLGLGSLNVWWPALAGTLGSPTMFVAISMAVGNLVVWVVVVHVALRRLLASNSIRRLGRAHAHVDLFRLDALRPFGRVGSLDLLIVAIAVSFAAFQSLDAELRWENYSAAFAAGIPAGLALLLLPMVGIRQNVRQAKRLALARLDEAIAKASRELERRPLQTLGELVRQRDLIEHAREWPLDTTALSRIALYFVIPPVAWVGGALAEFLIDAVIGPGS